jgi:SIR2-like domain
VKILVFSGAGASFGVSPTKYPTTAGFYAEHVAKSNLRDRPLFTILDDYVRREKAQSTADLGGSPGSDIVVDIEDILFAAHGLRDTFSQFQSASRSIARFATFHEKIQSYGSYGNNTTALLEATVPHLDELIREINRMVHRAYAASPTSDELEATWLPLLRALNEKAASLNVFTTNYDLVLENALRLAGLPVKEGYTDGVTRTLDINAWRNFGSWGTRAKGLLTKLHGSLHWLKGDEEEIEVTGSSFKDHDRQVAIYPGYKGVPNDEPFFAFHQYFASCVADADLVVIVGFAFRDDYLNEVITVRAPSKQKVIVIDPNAKSLKLPFPGSPELIEKKFGDPTVLAAINAIWSDT